LLGDLRSDFALKDLGDLSLFSRHSSQENKGWVTFVFGKICVSEVLKKAGMCNCKPGKTPLTALEKLSVSNGEALPDAEATKHRGIVGGLQYLTLTRLDISFSINKVCQFLHAPTNLHLTAVKQILRYVQNTSNLSLKFRGTSSLKPSAFSDVDWAGCPDNRHSTGGFAIYLGNNLVSWGSRK
jgi:hypothetical protein